VRRACSVAHLNQWCPGLLNCRASQLLPGACNSHIVQAQQYSKTYSSTICLPQACQLPAQITAICQGRQGSEVITLWLASKAVPWYQTCTQVAINPYWLEGMQDAHQTFLYGHTAQQREGKKQQGEALCSPPHIQSHQLHGECPRQAVSMYACMLSHCIQLTQHSHPQKRDATMIGLPTQQLWRLTLTTMLRAPMTGGVRMLGCAVATSHYQQHKAPGRLCIAVRCDRVPTPSTTI
jgi:hypothetical protein